MKAIDCMAWRIGSLSRNSFEINLGYNIRNWALPLSFGGGIWADEEIGDYGQVYSCEYFRSVIVLILCFRVSIEWSVP